MTTTICFWESPGDDNPDTPDPDDLGCQCPPGDNRFLLAIEEGGIILTHAACGKQPAANWGDWQEVVTMDTPIPVTAKWATDCDGSRWHGGGTPCDCDHWIEITPTLPPSDSFNVQGRLGSTENGACTNCGAGSSRWCEHCASCPDGCYGGHKHTDRCPEAP